MTTVLANGVWDGLHYGHLLHLRAARDMGDRLVVSVTCDESVRRERGKERPMFNEQQRMAMLQELRCVDSVILVKNRLEAVRSVRPDIFVKGPDYADSIDSDVELICHLADCGGEIRLTTGPKWSATDLVNEFRSR